VDAARNEYAMVEEFRNLIERLVRERQQLRAAGAIRRRLEANRLELIRAQWALAGALIERSHLAVTPSGAFSV
jgi:hypothetical protein